MGRADIAWINGIPVHKYVEPVNKSEVNNEPLKGGNVPYKMIRDKDGFVKAGEEEFDGMTCLQVAWRRQWQLAGEGDLQALNACMDRTVGKPKQTIDTTSVQITWQDYAASRIAINEAKGITFDAVDVIESNPELDF